VKILLIEDNPVISWQIEEFLSAHCWELDFARTAREGITLALASIYDVILLDLNLPDGDGLEVCAEIKNKSDVIPPILMLTARDSFEDKAAGFHRGADDYLVKPFDLRELVLRCEALARRQALHQPKLLELGSLTLDKKLKIALHNGTSMELTGIGFQILELLASAYPAPVSRSVISHHLWGDHPPESDALKSHIYALRKSLDRSFGRPVLTTIMNVGYKLDLHELDLQECHR
jgi:DNA-binding response OmpR family regulator